LLLLILIVLLIIYIIWKRRCSTRQPSVKKPRPVTIFPEDSTKPIAFSKFHEQVDFLAENTNLEYAKEFEVSVFFNYNF